MKTFLLGTCAGLLLLGCNQQKATHNQTDSAIVQQSAPAEATTKSEATTRSVAFSSPIRFSFEEAPVGKLPEGWKTFKTGPGDKMRWETVSEGGNKVLAQLLDDNPGGHFNIAIYEPVMAKNVSLQTRFKSVKGKTDQGGGFVWRFRDADNYYIVRANSLENNVVLYKVENGKRTDLPLVGKGKTYGAEAKVPTVTWHTLELNAMDSVFIVGVNGKELFRVVDKTFAGAGKVGFWSKADAVTYFDDFLVEINDK